MSQIDEYLAMCYYPIQEHLPVLACWGQPVGTIPPLAAMDPAPVLPAHQMPVVDNTGQIWNPIVNHVGESSLSCWIQQAGMPERSKIVEFKNWRPHRKHLGPL
ncbi:hypothetical protein R1flu_007919 [Riccia fluitans]|uniref:Uncharacterized protein n=1 Tax=Riccia fluitans TaxID=41844 RepID=A0ABD1Z073_9MARC